MGAAEATADLERGCSPRSRDAGAATARDLDDGRPRAKEHWGWNWSEARKVLDYLFLVGEVAIAGRNSQFEVVYDLPERVLPAAGPGGADARRSRTPTASWSAGRRARTAWRP